MSRGHYCKTVTLFRGVAADPQSKPQNSYKTCWNQVQHPAYGMELKMSSGPVTPAVKCPGGKCPCSSTYNPDSAMNCLCCYFK